MARKKRTSLEEIEAKAEEAQKKYIESLGAGDDTTLSEDEIIALSQTPADGEGLPDNENAIENAITSDEGAPVVEGGQAASPAEPAATGQEPSQPPAEPVVHNDNWEHKYNVLKGKYDSEVPLLNSQVRTLTDEIKNLQAVVLTLSQKAEDEPGYQGSFTVEQEDAEGMDHFRSEYPDVAKYVDAVIRSSSTQIARDQIGPVAAKIEGVEKTINETKAMEFERELTNAVPDWRSINMKPEFMTWLSEVEPFSGQTRLALLRNAHAAQNTETVIKIFKAFADEGKPREGAGVSAIQEDLTTLAPSTTPSPAVTVTPQAVKRVSRDFIKKFYNDLALGRYSDMPTEAEAISKEINKAIRENRIS